MSSNIQLYSKGITVESIQGSVLFSRVSEVRATLNDVDASDFVSEFTVDEILNAMDFNDVAQYVRDNECTDDVDFSGATNEGNR